jgi:hypothetical protein
MYGMTPSAMQPRIFAGRTFRRLGDQFAAYCVTIC